MGSDRARVSYDANQQYRGVVAQQGRVTLESDWNEAEQIASEEQREQLLDVIGSRGTPDDGYRVIETGEGTSPAFDFTVQKGTMYVGGVRTTLPSNVTYSDQTEWLDRTSDPDWVDPSTIENQRELIYLLLREQEVSAVEDSTLRDPALGGPDTTQRTRLTQRIVRLQTKNSSCEEAIDEAQSQWLQKGLSFNPQTMRLESSASLQVSFVESAAPPDPCDPEARGGYLGAENQLIRVQISSVASESGQNKLVWGFDNASALYRVSATNDTTLKLQSQPVDANHQPKAGQVVVEVLRSAAQLHNGEFIASATGLVTTLATSYNPDTQEITLPASLPTEYLDPSQTPRLFLRVWQEEIAFSPNTAVRLGETGLQVTLQTSEGHPFHKGDYWHFSARPLTPTEVYPQRYLDTFQSPEGSKLWICPLSVVEWNDGILEVLEDCREPFDSLVELTKRNSGCCTISLKPEDLNNGITLQQILDDLADQTRHNRDHVTICLKPGVYSLKESLIFGPEHSNFTLEGCGDGAEIQIERGKESNFLHGMIILNHANYVTFKDLRFQLPLVPFAEAGGELVVNESFVDLFPEEIEKTLYVSIGIRPLHCALLTVKDCLFRFEVQKIVNLFAVGIFAASECWGLQLIGNRFLRDEEYLIVQEATAETEQRFLIGYLLSPSFLPPSGDDQIDIVPSLLQDAVIRDNRFDGLTTAMLIHADAGLVRLESNVVLQCISGFWLTPFELALGIISDKNFTYYSESYYLSEGNQAYYLGLLYPLPSFFRVDKLIRKFVVETLGEDIQKNLGFDRLSLSLHASGNDIYTHVTTSYEEASRETPLSGPGLIVAGNLSQKATSTEQLITSSVLLTNNKIRNNMPLKEREGVGIKLYGTTVLIWNVERSVVSGNLLLNEFREGICLIVVPIEDIPISISITGNVLQGATRLPRRENLDSSIPGSMSSWEFLNTVIDP